MKVDLWQLLGIAIPLVLLAVFFGRYDELGERPDSAAYTNFAQAIYSGDLFEKKELSEVRYWRAARTPGYPILIAIATGGEAENTGNILYLHLFLAALSVVFVCLVLRPYCPPILTGLVVVAAQIFMRDYFTDIMTEWAAFNLLLILFGMLIVCIQNMSLRNLFILGLISAFAVLVRPALLPLIVIAPGIYLYGKSYSFKGFLILGVSMLPVVLWMSLNLYQIESFTLAQLRGHNLFGIGSMIGHADSIESDTQEFKDFVVEFNEKKRPPVGEADQFVADFDKTYNKLQFESNIYWIADKIRKPEWGVIVFWRDYLGPYGERAISANLGNYAKYVLHGLKVFYQYGLPYLAVFLLLIPAYCLYRKKATLVSVCTLILFFVHFSQAIVVSSVQTVFDRFVVLSFYPYLAAITICLISLAITEKWFVFFARFLPAPVNKVLGHLFALQKRQPTA